MIGANCATFGKSKQYCAPKNSTRDFGSQRSDFEACFALAPCICSSGACAFDKGDAYYACVDEVEQSWTEALIKQVVREAERQANQTAANSTNKSV